MAKRRQQELTGHVAERSLSAKCLCQHAQEAVFLKNNAAAFGANVNSGALPRAYVQSLNALSVPLSRPVRHRAFPEIIDFRAHQKARCASLAPSETPAETAL